MTAIWSNGGERWRLLVPSGFPDEASLHTLIEQSPQLLPLAGSPRLTIVGREVRLGSGSADLLAVEPNGRLVVIEVKLANKRRGTAGSGRPGPDLRRLPARYPTCRAGAGGARQSPATARL